MRGTTATLVSDQGVTKDVENLLSFVAQEDATPLDPNDSFGGVGQVTFSFPEDEGAELFLGNEVLILGGQGKTSGVVENVTINNGVTSVQSSSTLSKFNVEKTIYPFVGTFGQAIQNYCNEVSITNTVVIDEPLASRPVIYPGWSGNVWVHLKQLLAKEKVELSLVFDTITVRPVREVIATTERATDMSFSFDRSNPARAIEINYYNHDAGVNLEVYPLRDEDPTIFQVDAGETITFTQQLNASLVHVNQPVPLDWVDDDTYAGTNGVYSIVGNDGLPITAAQWLAQEGKLEVKITDDPSVIEITIVGAGMREYAPYRIAMSSGASNHYNSLHITGTGVSWDRKTLRLPTGATQVSTSEDVGVVVDNPFVSTLSDAYTLGMLTACAFAGLNGAVSGVALGINRKGDSKEGIVATMADFDEQMGAGATFLDFNTSWSGSTFAEFNAYYDSLVDELFSNQLFGNAAGARVLHDRRNYRIVSASHELSGLTSFQATSDTTIEDVNPLWESMTFADFNEAFSGLSFREFSLAPLVIGGINE